MASIVPTSLTSLLGVSCSIKVVDIGANTVDGAPPYAPLMAANCADIVGFEPNLQALETLNAQKGPRETYLPNAVGDGRTHSLQMCQAPGMTSLLEPDPAVLDLFHGFSDWGRVVGREKLKTVRLDDVPETQGLDYLKIDIQGGELMVFEHGKNRLKNALIVHTEVEFLPMYKNQPLFSDVDTFLREQGFLIHRFEPLTSRALKPLMVGGDPFAPFSQIFWADAIFLKNILNLDTYTTPQLLKLAVILNDCYRSFDVALRLLTEYDKREKTRHGEVYLSALTTPMDQRALDAAGV